MLFGGPLPSLHQHHQLTQYSSLPRRSATTASASSAFQRNTPIRRSTGIPEHHIEYFVPRSISEFNLSGVGDLALPPPRRSPIESSYGSVMTSLPPPPPSSMHNLQSGGGLIQQTILCGPSPPPPPQMQIMMKPREKMVTFEDESNVAKGIGMIGGTVTHCPHGVPTTPRKISSSNTVNSISSTAGTSGMGGNSIGIGTIVGSDVFM